MGAAGFRIAALALLGAGCTSIHADARTFEGTRWLVTAVNGHPAPPGYPFFIAFERGRFKARMGCNIADGVYRIAGDMLVPGMASRTEMACEEVLPSAIPVMNYERWGFDVFRHPMRMRWRSSRELTLNNGAGSIELKFGR